ncbi:MAG: hypothetical protein Hyperionvirus27_19 [Hyperionvirus sp.]|uniref:Uncharacterized protein n=1 Tax=Hyperionvirus sp. TaxID=2487770 RepID=A0A3G5AGH4_9VIRU|nr:MAG: hypothetical protein Hyperionvirus27_19 [Hyperionvirus sp.]
MNRTTPGRIFWKQYMERLSDDGVGSFCLLSYFFHLCYKRSNPDASHLSLLRGFLVLASFCFILGARVVVRDHNFCRFNEKIYWVNSISLMIL